MPGGPDTIKSADPSGLCAPPLIQYKSFESQRQGTAQPCIFVGTEKGPALTGPGSSVEYILEFVQKILAVLILASAAFRLELAEQLLLALAEALGDLHTDVHDNIPP